MIDLMAKKREKFGRLVRGAINAMADFEGKNVARIQEELGELIQMAPTAFHRFKQGFLPTANDMVDTIRILATASVQRAYLNRVWLEAFLTAAEYPQAAELMAELYPHEALTARPPRSRSNLPAPPYSQFVMRPAAYADVAEGLTRRSAVVLIVSLSGMGKTSLAHEAATHALAGQAPMPQFDAVVWVSDRDHPGATTLARVLDEIARTLDYPGLSRFDLQLKRFEGEQLLRHQRVLLVIDNFETITDDALLHWLLRLPEPSKALITTRTYRPAFQQGAWLVELGGMPATEAEQVIDQRARQLKLKHAGSAAERHRFITLTGGNPKAIEMVLGYVRHTGQPLAQVLDRLHTGHDVLFDDLFAQSRAVLSPPAQHVLLTLTFFAASASRTALAATAGVEAAAFEAAVQQLLELSLLDTEPGTAAQPPRLRLHPLTRAVASTWLTAWPDLAHAARARWLNWCVTCAAEVGFMLDDLERLQRLDVEEPNLAAALSWAAEHGYDQAVVQLASGIEFYYYVRALWSKKLALHQQYIEAAHRLNDADEEINALALHIQLLGRQGNPNAATPYLARLRNLAQTHPLTGLAFFQYHHTLGHDALARGDLATAQQAWQDVLDAVTDQGLSAHMHIGAHHWLATCLYRQGNLDAARQHYAAALAQARQHGFTRFIARNQLQLARIELEQGYLEAASRRLTESLTHTQPDDWEQQAHLQRVQAQVHARHGDTNAARAALNTAINLLERMGLTHEMRSARMEQAALDEYPTR